MKRRMVIWAAGFVALFVINILVEVAVLPALGLSNSENNDLYFQMWWVAVASWLVLGNMVLDVLIPHSKSTAGNIGA